uniref:Exostosin GT47 domain-containing protein n=1 Tax=Aureoumbra lagunensis TaxID=44058 RepID=A0A7S3K095_9STRA
MLAAKGASRRAKLNLNLFMPQRNNYWNLIMFMPLIKGTIIGISLCVVVASDRNGFTIIRVPGAMNCRTRYFNVLLSELELHCLNNFGDPIASFVDMDTALASWPNMNAALQDEDSWISGSKADCYGVHRLNEAAQIINNENITKPLVLFNFAAPNCFVKHRGDPHSDINCPHARLYHVDIIEIMTAADINTFRSGFDISFPLHLSPMVTPRFHLGENGFFSNIFERPVKLSFVGTATHSVRRRLASAIGKSLSTDVIVELRDPRNNDDIIAERRNDTRLFEDLSTKFGVTPRTRDNAAIAIMEASQFVVTPRGHSLHSSRLLEAMAAGAVPVVLSDGWVLPLSDLIDWDKVVLRIPEADAEHILDVVRSINNDQWNAMALAGHQIFQEYFITPRHSINALLRILQDRHSSSP